MNRDCFWGDSKEVNFQRAWDYFKDILVRKNMKPEVLILVGLPGSGKSTYAEKLATTHYRINQDTLGSKDACVAALHPILRSKNNVVIDRCNHDKKQRKLWIDLAQYYGADVKCLYLSVDPEVCLERIFLRKNHPTITADLDANKKRSIIAQFLKGFELPTLDEGFSEVTYKRNA